MTSTSTHKINRWNYYNTSFMAGCSENLSALKEDDDYDQLDSSPVWAGRYRQGPGEEEDYLKLQNINVPKESDIKKSCLAPTAKAIPLDTFGNLPNTSLPLKDLILESVVVQKFIYDSDLPQKTEPAVVRSTHSRFKRRESISAMLTCGGQAAAQTISSAMLAAITGYVRTQEKQQMHIWLIQLNVNFEEVVQWYSEVWKA
ncbi:hypothetical protein ARMSODRAFT_972119 [Armillaria solidipes]|uniref:Uncharacterized protein n=1 Tax=Armillaria solidipes TaxID=1076256 RepID=A0A2H3BSB7_9AGAR|nr:hypothetical protein ARMSODRAFT_972119 [Armillaria solidipes]